MAEKEKDKVYFLNSRFLQGNVARLPQPNTVDYGEIAINYKTGYEVISFKNSNNIMVKLEPTVVTEAEIEAKYRTIYNTEDEPTTAKEGDFWVKPIVTT